MVDDTNTQQAINNLSELVCSGTDNNEEKHPNAQNNRNRPMAEVRTKKTEEN